jgi:hypothetical protein
VAGDPAARADPAPLRDATASATTASRLTRLRSSGRWRQPPSPRKYTALDPPTDPAHSESTPALRDPLAGNSRSRPRLIAVIPRGAVRLHRSSVEAFPVNRAPALIGPT